MSDRKFFCSITRNFSFYTKWVDGKIHLFDEDGERIHDWEEKLNLDCSFPDEETYLYASYDSIQELIQEYLEEENHD